MGADRLAFGTAALQSPLSKSWEVGVGVGRRVRDGRKDEAERRAGKEWGRREGVRDSGGSRKKRREQPKVKEAK